MYNRIFTYLFLPLLFIFAVGTLVGCGEFNSRVGNTTSIFDQSAENIPSLEVSNFTTSSYERGELRWILYSDFAQLYEQQKRTLLTNIDFKNYNEKREVTSSAVAKKSILESDTGNIVLENDVRILNTSGTLIEGNYFYWDSDTKKFTSPKYVKITKKDGSVLSGEGFSANQELGDIEFRSKVKGQVGDAKRDDFFDGFE